MYYYAPMKDLQDLFSDRSRDMLEKSEAYQTTNARKSRIYIRNLKYLYSVLH